MQDIYNKYISVIMDVFRLYKRNQALPCVPSVENDRLRGGTSHRASSQHTGVDYFPTTAAPKVFYSLRTCLFQNTELESGCTMKSTLSLITSKHILISNTDYRFSYNKKPDVIQVRATIVAKVFI